MKIMKPILVVGDLIIDVYHYGKEIGVAPDSPNVVAFREATKIFYGGAGLVVTNILALGGSVVFVTLVGKGEYSKYAETFKHKRLKQIFLKDPKRPTTVKERFWANGHKLLDWRHFDTRQINSSIERQLLAHIKRNLPRVDKVLLADYRHGLLSEYAASAIVKLCQKAHVPLYVDSQITHAKGNHRWYKGATLFSLNLKEASDIDPLFDQKKLKHSLTRLQKILAAEHNVVKLGANGSAALLGKTFIKTNPHAVTAVDPVGAGDAFVAALALAKNPPTPHDLKRANIWAALSTTIIGTEPPSLRDLEKILDS